MNRNYEAHTKAVAGWWDVHAKGLSRNDLVQLAEKALAALFQRANATMSKVILTAVAERVLTNGSEAYDLLSDATMEDGKFQLHGVGRRINAATEQEIRAALQFLITQY